MYRGKRAKSTKSIYIMASVVLLIALAVGGTLAYIATKTSDVTNTFTLGTVPIKVEEDITTEAGVKKDVKIKNEGTVDAYIRAKVIVNWVKLDEDGNPTNEIYGQAPVPNMDYTLEYANDTGWTPLNGYYYFTDKVAPGESTGDLVASCSPNIVDTTGKTPNQPDGYTLSVEILAQSIQADGKNSEGKTPIELAWGEAAAALVATN